MLKLEFWKYHGIGNDFIVVEDFRTKLSFKPNEIRAICDRKKGVGADGILIINKRGGTYYMRTLNSDGTEAEMCGNGVRCVAKHLFDNGLAPRRFDIETRGGKVGLEVVSSKGEASMVRVGMGRPRLERREIPMTGKGRCIDAPIQVGGRDFKVTAVSMGNPHAVVFEGLSVDEARIWGPLFESHPWFPERTNTEFVDVVNDREIRVVVYERGCGITQACGTGACASVVAGALKGVLGIGVQVTVHLLGGDLEIELAPGLDQVWMTGPAERVFRGELTRGMKR
jgi:diaminopimelate epimerase